MSERYFYKGGFYDELFFGLLKSSWRLNSLDN